MINMFAMSAKRFLSKIAVALISDKFIEWAFFEIADRIVSSTSTPHDDKWLEKLKEEYKHE